MSTPEPTDRYAIVTPGFYGPDVSFWANHAMVIKMLTTLAREPRSEGLLLSVWHRRTAKSRWECVS